LCALLYADLVSIRIYAIKSKGDTSTALELRRSLKHKHSKTDQQAYGARLQS
jgi:hypothetical protein